MTSGNCDLDGNDNQDDRYDWDDLDYQDTKVFLQTIDRMVYLYIEM